MIKDLIAIVKTQQIESYIFFVKLFENVRRPNVMNFTHSKCHRKLSNVRNKNLNVTITVKNI
jgi:hypothetical protein